jgi:hypothetical protein
MAVKLQQVSVILGTITVIPGSIRDLVPVLVIPAEAGIHLINLIISSNA